MRRARPNPGSPNGPEDLLRDRHVFNPVPSSGRDPAGDLAHSVVGTLTRVVGAAPRAWRAFKNNPKFVGGVQKILDQRTRNDGFVDLAGWLTGKLLQPAVSEGFAAAKGFPDGLIQSPIWNDFGLGQVPHLGVLDSLVLARVSRADYVALCLGNLLKIKRQYAHLGLGRHTDLSFRGEALTNLEVAQTWAIVLNAGHLFGTFATERALMFKLYEERKLRPAFFDSIQSEPRALRNAAEEIIRQTQLFRAHYALAAWRVSRLKNNATRDIMLQCLARFFERSRVPGDPIVWAFKRARQLAYNRIHQAVGVGSLIQGDISSDLGARLLDVNPIAFHEHSDKENWALQLLDHADAFYQRTFFTSPAATQVVLAHIREFDVWWKKMDEVRRPFDDRLGSLFTRPVEWNDPTKPILKPFVRLDLPDAQEGWCKVVQDIRGDGSAWSAWKVLVTPFPSDGSLVCDVCWDGTPAPASCHALAQRLGERVVTSWEE